METLFTKTENKIANVVETKQYDTKDKILDIQVFETHDYAKFKHLKGNRKLNAVQIEKLIQSMKEWYVFTIIFINQFYEIIDGQNRFEAIKKLNLPVRYMILYNYGLKEVQKLNTLNRVWNNESYMDSFCEIKNEEYIKLRNFLKMFPDFNISTAQIILSNKSSAVTKSRNNKNLITNTNKRGAYRFNEFQTGNFYVENYELSVNNAKKLMEIKQYSEVYNRIQFVRCMINLFKNEKYNHTIFMKKLSSQPKSLTPCTNVTQYTQLVENIYNYRSRNKVSLIYS